MLRAHASSLNCQLSLDDSRTHSFLLSGLLPSATPTPPLGFTRFLLRLATARQTPASSQQIGSLDVVIWQQNVGGRSVGVGLRRMSWTWRAYFTSIHISPSPPLPSAACIHHPRVSDCPQCTSCILFSKPSVGPVILAYTCCPC